MSTPRGIRNCNPLNIRRNETKWQGLRPVSYTHLTLPTKLEV